MKEVLLSSLKGVLDLHLVHRIVLLKLLQVLPSVWLHRTLELSRERIQVLVLQEPLNDLLIELIASLLLFYILPLSNLLGHLYDILLTSKSYRLNLGALLSVVRIEGVRDLPQVVPPPDAELAEVKLEALLIPLGELCDPD